MIKRIRSRLFNILYGFVKYMPWGVGRILRFFTLKIAGADVNTTYILEGATFICPERISIGKHACINEWVFLQGAGNIIIGNWVMIAHGVSIISSDHGYDSLDIPICNQKINLKKVIIEDDVWIGCGAKILKGVTIGKGAIIGAGSVVTKNIPPYSIAAGNPCSVIRNRTDQRNS